VPHPREARPSDSFVLWPVTKKYILLVMFARLQGDQIGWIFADCGDFIFEIFSPKNLWQITVCVTFWKIFFTNTSGHPARIQWFYSLVSLTSVYTLPKTEIISTGQKKLIPLRPTTRPLCTWGMQSQSLWPALFVSSQSSASQSKTLTHMHARSVRRIEGMSHFILFFFHERVDLHWRLFA
jgi:hypothetical protein